MGKTEDQNVSDGGLPGVYPGPDGLPRTPNQGVPESEHPGRVDIAADPAVTKTVHPGLDPTSDGRPDRQTGTPPKSPVVMPPATLGRPGGDRG